MKERILLAEDYEDMARLLRWRLESLGYEVAVARDGREAVKMAVSQLPDLIVMDIVMPKMDGLQAACRIRKNPKTQAIPILAFTARSKSADKEECLASGCDGYIAKPFTYKELQAAIEELLKRRGQRRSNRSLNVAQT